EIGEAARHPDFVALENPGIALDRLHQRARLSLLGGRALAKAAAAQAVAQLADALRRRGEIMLSKEIGVHRQISFDPLEPCQHASERAHMFAEARHGRARRYGSIAAAGHHQLGAAAELDRL